jgi:hypothetical protein
LFFIGSGCLILNVPLVFDNASTNVVLFADAVRDEPIMCVLVYPAIVLHLPPTIELNSAGFADVAQIKLLLPPPIKLLVAFPLLD